MGELWELEKPAQPLWAGYIAIHGTTVTPCPVAPPRLLLKFTAEMDARAPSAKVRGRALVDLMKGLQIRAKAGIAREQLLQDARSYVPLILGK